MKKIIRRIKTDTKFRIEYYLTRQIIWEPTEYVVRKILNVIAHQKTYKFLLIITFEPNKQLYIILHSEKDWEDNIRKFIQHIKTSNLI